MQSFDCPNTLTIAELRKSYTAWVFKLCRYNKAKTAKTLGIALRSMPKVLPEPSLPERALARRKHALKKYADDDFAQWIAERTLRGVGLKQLLQHSRIEYLRETHGQTRRGQNRVEVSLSPSLPVRPITETSLAAFVYDNPWLSNASERTRVIACLLYMGFKKQEVAMVLGVSATRIGQLLDEIRSLIPEQNRIS